jgi:hypothetical protein
MPKAEHHRSKAERNRRFLGTISTDDYPEWVVVAAFYTAVHHAERLRAISGHGDSTGHEDRLDYIQHEHSTIHTHYHILQTVSMLARYQSIADFATQFQPADIPERVIAQRLVPIETYVETQTRK